MHHVLLVLLLVPASIGAVPRESGTELSAPAKNDALLEALDSLDEKVLVLKDLMRADVNQEQAKEPCGDADPYGRPCPGGRDAQVEVADANQEQAEAYQVDKTNQYQPAHKKKTRGLKLNIGIKNFDKSKLKKVKKEDQEADAETDEPCGDRCWQPCADRYGRPCPGRDAQVEVADANQEQAKAYQVDKTNQYQPAHEEKTRGLKLNFGIENFDKSKLNKVTKKDQEADQNQEDAHQITDANMKQRDIQHANQEQAMAYQVDKTSQYQPAHEEKTRGLKLNFGIENFDKSKLNKVTKNDQEAEAEAEVYTRLGCWKDTAIRAIPQLDGSDPKISGNYESRMDAINKCYEVAKAKGMVVFAVQNGGWCAADSELYGYAKYGEAKNCRNGKGGAWANDVYRILDANPGPGEPRVCEDVREPAACEYYKSIGYCESLSESTKDMKEVCTKTCGFCEDTDAEIHQQRYIPGGASQEQALSYHVDRSNKFQAAHKEKTHGLELNVGIENFDKSKLKKVTKKDQEAEAEAEDEE